MKETKRFKLVILFLLVTTSMLIILPSVSSTLTGGRIIQADGSPLNLVYDTSSNAHADNVAALNANAALRIYGTAAADVQSMYVGGVYAVGAGSGNRQYVIITTVGDPPLVQTAAVATGCGAGCFYADTPFSLQFASIIVPGTSGNPGAAFFPAYPSIVVSNGDSVVHDADPFVFLYPGNGSLSGSYTLNNVQASYNQTTGNISLDITAISTEGDTDHPNNAFLMVGVCNDTYGINCSSTTATSYSASEVKLNTSIVLPPDTTTWTRYAVVNGIGSSFCIGPDLDITAVTPNPASGPPGTSVTLTATITNQNNVNVTQNYAVDFYKDSVIPANKIGATQTVTLDLGPSASTTAQVTWDTTAITDGAHNLYARLTDTGIGDCDESNDNATNTFTTQLVYFPAIWIDGISTLNFSDSGRPYNLTFQINNSNGVPQANTVIKITEENGISLLAPLQTFITSDNVRRGVKPISIAHVTTDANGFANLAIIPTGNKLYSPEYAYTNVSNHTGNYSLYFEIFNSAGTELQLYYGGQTVGQINFTVFNLTNRWPNSTEQYTLSVFNQDTYVKAFLNYAYQTFAIARRWMST